MSRRSLARMLADTLRDGGWRSKARPEQLAPAGDWNGWLVMAGRGFGKTRTGTEWVHECVQSGNYGRVGLVAPTAADGRDVIVEGDSGLLNIAPNWFRPTFEPSKRRIVWPNGAIATLFSAEEPERLRGPQFDLAYADELAAWAKANLQTTWDMLMFGLRLGERPRWAVTTTPKPIKLLKELLVRDDVVVTRGSTFDNEANLAASFLAQVRTRYEGTRLGRQELSAELLEDTPGALWTIDMIDRAKAWSLAGNALPDMKRVVVAIDPSGTRGEEDSGDSIGIIVAGLGVDNFGYVLADKTCKLSPAGWGAVAVEAYRDFSADRIVAERNFGGAMVEHVIRTVDLNVPFREVTASRGKIARAEPVSALYEQGRIRHAGFFVALEDQMAEMTSNGYVGDGSPDRVDALVWALSELFNACAAEVPIVMPFSASRPNSMPDWTNYGRPG